MKRIFKYGYLMNVSITLLIISVFKLVSTSKSNSSDRVTNAKNYEKLCFMKMCCSELFMKSKVLKIPKRSVFCKLLKNENRYLNFETCNLFQENFKNFFKFVFLTDQNEFNLKKKCSDTLNINIETLHFNSQNLNFKICLQGVKDVYLRTGYKNFTNKLCFKFVSGVGKDSVSIVKRMRRDGDRLFVSVNNNKSYSQVGNDQRIIPRFRDTAENRNLSSNKTFLTLKNLMETLNENLLKVHRDLESIFPNYASTNLSKTPGFKKEIYDNTQIYNFSIHKSPTHLNSDDDFKQSSHITKSLEPVVIEILKEQNSEAMYINKETQDVVTTIGNTTTIKTLSDGAATATRKPKTRPISTPSMDIMNHPHLQVKSHIIPEREENGKSELIDGEIVEFSKHDDKAYDDEEIFGFKSLIGKKAFVPIPQETEENYFDSPLMPHEIASLNDQVLDNNRFRVKREPFKYFRDKRNSFHNSFQSNKYYNDGNILIPFANKNYTKVNDFEYDVNSTGDSDEEDAIRRLNNENWQKLRTFLNNYFLSVMPNAKLKENDFTGPVDLSQWKHIQSFRSRNEEVNGKHFNMKKSSLTGNEDIPNDDDLNNNFKLDLKDENLPFEFGYPSEILPKEQTEIHSKLKKCQQIKSTFEIQGCESRIDICSDTEVKFNDSTFRDNVLQEGFLCLILLKYLPYKKEMKILSMESNVTKFNLEFACEQNFIQLTLASQRNHMSVCGSYASFSSSVKFNERDESQEIVFLFTPKLNFQINVLNYNITANIESMRTKLKDATSYLNTNRKDTWKQKMDTPSQLEDRDKIIVVFLLIFFFFICMSLLIKNFVSKNNHHLKESKDGP